MKKYATLFSLICLLISPAISSAQQGDVDDSGDPSCALISTNLRYLSTDAKTGGAVSILQDFLYSNGYLSVQPTGFFGGMTRKSVIAFQNTHGISATPPGYVGALTRQKIKEVDCGGQTSNTAILPVSTSTDPVVLTNNPSAYIRVESVVGNETWAMDSGYNVLWSYGYLTGNVKVSLVNGGKICSLGISNVQPGSLTVHPKTSIICTDGTVLTPGSYKVRISSVVLRSASADSTGSVTLVSNSSEIPTISVLSPKAGDTYTAGQTVNIKWTPGGSGISYINFYKDDSSYSTAFRPAYSADPSGSGYFTFPQDMPAGKYKIYAFYETTISGVISSKKVFDSENSYITITPASNTTTTPPQTSTPVTTPATNTSANTSCPQSVTINGTTYTLSPCTIAASMIDGRGNKNFSTTIVSSGGSTSSYGYGVQGYGVGFPTYGILGGTSGGASGNTTLNLYFNDNNLSADGAQSKTYSGYLPIRIYQDSSSGNDSYLYLNLNLAVNPS